ncbi:hypothetical protein DFQ11_102686 [Winogradskyella epiphytica]|uniref:Type ISP restriction-modification enzyme LLaBIII C-terminal specificity domain-containing protein n=1 Tax=Winogradskyella epiphytica TaxID=262005 RepID=A0A2V4XGB8_9FLAO|nr:hypothetical protein [Winogradskyella epiphytica]PYE82105.1 hypothetical protein DFQ11_102686 [Winogradskyella epiphytica]GGW60499.1 hypothetical protein GCM10008085_09900 [Winogradskyella epiphytica]
MHIENIFEYIREIYHLDKSRLHSNSREVKAILQAMAEIGTTKVPDSNIDLHYLILYIEKSFQLSFETNESQDPNVCFIKSHELRDDYKTTFTPQDLFNYLAAIIQSTPLPDTIHQNQKTPSIPHPKDEKTFWKMVKLGSHI